ncbi:hypothetical protein RSOLAG22IIIB_09052 [Rhizoctonia solani]|uniref:Uncharacterized protein n=1 Tax=Rhizoctonia solani TaxID=456999 RepID=A0A0K6FWU6_9AGAM|nr:hypothetical protein RSOLAG22IIIB_09052 [Rhizoctonia solani]
MSSPYYDPPSTTYEKPLDEHAFPTLRSGTDDQRPRLGIRAKVLLPTILNKLSTANAFSSGYILADEGTKKEGSMESATLRALTATSFISTFINATSPVLILLISYQVAHSWIEKQARPAVNSTDAGLTPLQYGMLVEVLGSPSILSLSTAVYYLFRQKTRSPVPPYFLRAVILGVVVFLVTHLVGLADLWLHAVTSAVVYNLPLENHGVAIDASFVFNDTKCNGPPMSSCYKSTSNTSSERKIITLAAENDLAIMVPTVTNQSIAFDSTSVGIYAACTSLIHEENGCVAYAAYVNCSEIGISVLPSKGYMGRGTPSLVFLNKPDNDWANPAFVPGENYFRTHACCSGNPTESILQLSWEFSGGDEKHPDLNEALVVLPPAAPVRLYARCDLTVYNVTLSYNGSAEGERYWSLATKTLSDPRFADAVLSAYGWNLISDQAAQNVKSRAMSADPVDQVMAALNQEISRLALGMVSGLFDLTPATNVQAFSPTILGRYPLGPLLVFVALLLIYGIITLAIFGTSLTIRSGVVIVPQTLRASRSMKKNQEKDKTILTLELVQLRLTSPIPAFLQFFEQSRSSHPPGPEDPDVRSVSESIVGLFNETDTSKCTETRLRFGLEDTGLRPRFGIWRDQVMKDQNDM